MKTVGNILWVLLVGWWLALEYVIAGLLMLCPIVTIPLSVQAFKLAGYALWPFGRAVVDKPGNAAAAGIGNVIWLILAGWWLALSHLVAALLCFITIIGIPFGVANLKLAGLAIWPFGKTIVHGSLAGPGAVMVGYLGEPAPTQQPPLPPPPPGR